MVGGMASGNGWGYAIGSLWLMSLFGIGANQWIILVKCTERFLNLVCTELLMDLVDL